MKHLLHKQGRADACLQASLAAYCAPNWEALVCTWPLRSHAMTARMSCCAASMLTRTGCESVVGAYNDVFALLWQAKRWQQLLSAWLDDDEV